MFRLLPQKTLNHWKSFYFSHYKMSSFSNILVDVKDKLAVITINQPQKKNAIDATTYVEMTNALQSLSQNDDVTVTAITGAGEYYCSGTDLKEGMSGDVPLDEMVEGGTNRVRNVIGALIDHSKVLVAVINGPAIGIGVTTLGLCDIVYSVDTATFQTPFSRLGIIAEGCSSYTFPRIMGFSKANDMLLFSRKFSAQEACDAGLVAKVYTKEKLDSELWPELRKNAAELPPKALFYSKELIRRSHKDLLHGVNVAECNRLKERLASEDFLEAVMKFMGRKSKM